MSHVALVRRKPSFSRAATPGTCATCPVRRLALFQPLSSDEVTSIERFRVDTRYVEPGEAIYRRGESCANVFTLYDGWACLAQRPADGGRQILAFLLPGDFFGFQPDCGEDARIHSAHAITGVSLCVFSRAGLMEMFKGHIDLGMRLMWMAARDGIFAHEHMVSLGRRSARQRIAYLLLEVFHRVKARRQAAEQADKIDFPLTQEHIADACGLTHIHVSRTLSALKNENLLVVKNRTLEIPDIDGLASVANYTWNNGPKRPIL